MEECTSQTINYYDAYTLYEKITLKTDIFFVLILYNRHGGDAVKSY